MLKMPFIIKILLKEHYSKTFVRYFYYGALKDFFTLFNIYLFLIARLKMDHSDFNQLKCEYA